VSEPIPADSHAQPPLAMNLKQLASLLRQASHLDPDTQKSLASLLDELGQELDLPGTATAKTNVLTDAVKEVARSLHEQHPVGLLEAARDQLKEAAARAETEAPVVTGVVYRLIDALSSLGI
jgi:hypothetical protein